MIQSQHNPWSSSSIILQVFNATIKECLPFIDLFRRHSYHLFVASISTRIPSEILSFQSLILNRSHILGLKEFSNCFPYERTDITQDNNKEWQNYSPNQWCRSQIAFFPSTWHKSSATHWYYPLLTIICINLWLFSYIYDINENVYIHLQPNHFDIFDFFPPACFAA